MGKLDKSWVSIVYHAEISFDHFVQKLLHYPIKESHDEPALYKERLPWF